MNDKPRRSVQTIYGDGFSSAFELGALPGGLVSAQGAGGQPSAFIQVGSPATVWSATGGSFTYYPGILTLSGVPSAGTAVQCVFHHAVFSEAEIDYITAQYGDLNSQHLEVVRTLMMDATKRVAWMGGGVNYNESTVFPALEKMQAILWSAMTVQQGPQGGFESWAEEQQNNPAGW